MAEVLVTGASGFIGFHLAQALVARGDQVTCLVRKTSVIDRLRPLPVKVVYGDLADRESLRAAVAGKAVVYNVAGCTRALHVRQFYRVNADGPGNMAEACACQTSPPVLVTVSSLAAAGPSTADRPRVATDPLSQVSHYARSKRKGELAAQRFADRVPITVIRPPVVLGEWDRQGVTLFQTIDRLGIHLVPGWATHRYSLIHASDLANALILAAQRGSRLTPPGCQADQSAVRGFYFVAAEDNVTYAELGRLVGKALGRPRVWTFRVGMTAVRMISGAVELASQLRCRTLYLSLDKAREVTAGSWTCSPQAAVDDVGFSVGAPLLERLRQTAEWYRRAGWI
jgi:nucleoside-diphosphate-sugar epimerase